MKPSWSTRHAFQLVLVLALSFALILAVALLSESGPAAAAGAPSLAVVAAQEAMTVAGAPGAAQPAASSGPVWSPPRRQVKATPPRLPSRIADQAPPEPVLPGLPEEIHAFPRQSARETTVGIAGPAGLAAFGSSRVGDAAAVPPMPGDTSFVVDLATDRAWGKVGAGETVTVTVNGTQVGADQADDVGFFWTTLYDAAGDRVDLAGGEAVAFYADGVPQASTTLRAISGSIDLVDNTVAGTVDDLDSGVIDLYPGWDRPSLASLSWATTTDESGNFTYDFSGSWDFVAEGALHAAYAENGVEVQDTVYAPGLLVLPWPLFNVLGYTEPNSPVTVTVVMSDLLSVRGVYTTFADAWTGRYDLSEQNVEMEEGDVVGAVIAGGQVYTRTVDPLSLNVVASEDELRGTATPGAKVVGRARVPTADGWRVVSAETTVDASGVFTVAMGAQGDLWPGNWYGVYVPDDEGDDLGTWAPAQGAVSVDVYNNVIWGISPGPPAGIGAGTVVTMTLYDASASSTDSYTTTSEWFGEYVFNGDDFGLPQIEVGDVVTVEKAGFSWQGVMEIMTLTHSVDTDANQITGDAEPAGSLVFVSGQAWQSWSPQDLYPVAGSIAVSTTANSPYTAAPAGFDIRNAFEYWVERRNDQENQQSDFSRVDAIRVWPDYDGAILAFEAPGASYTVTLRTGTGDVKAVVMDTYPSEGSVWVSFWNAAEATVDEGDLIEARTSTGISTSTTVPPLRIVADTNTGILSGLGPANRMVAVQSQEEPPDLGFVPTDANGHFQVAMAELSLRLGDGVLSWGEPIRLCCEDFAGNHACVNPFWPQIVANYDMEGRSQVWGQNAAPGATVLVTVTHPVDGDIAFGAATAGSCDWCGPNGFSIDLPDGSVAPGNTVTVNFGDSLVESTVVADITASIDVVDDVVTGTAPANRNLHINVEHAWGDWGDLNTPIDATGAFTADFKTIGWDILPGDGFNVHVGDDRNHETQYSFWLAAPELSVSKERLSGYTRPGGLALYRIQYWHDGVGLAEDVAIIDTLPVSTTWFDDTSGVTPVQAGDTITWLLGDIDAGSGGDFYVTLGLDTGIMTGTDALDQNCVVITSTTPGELYPDNNEACAWHYDIWESNVDVSVDKWPNPSDPAPGETFEYTVNVCTGDGDSGTGATLGPVWLTDTLPISTSLVGWYVEPQQEQGLWREVNATDDELVLYAPALPGEWCHEVRVQLTVDPLAPLGIWLENTAVVAGADDVNPDNDVRVNNDAAVSEPRYDMSVDKWYNQGVQVPGGVLGFGIGFANNGNSAAHALVTDTLPAGTTYRPNSAYLPGDDQPTPFEPMTITADYVVWDLGTVDVAEGGDFWFEVDVDDGAATGVVTNCATIAGPMTDATPDDNDDCAYATLYAPGPNLAATKWANYEPGNDRIWYTVRVLNTGDETVDNVVITDTYPLDTYFTGDADVDGWYPFNIDGPHDDPGNRTLTWTLEYLEPGWSWQAWFDIGLDDPGAALRTYTNTVEVTTPEGDPSPDDNVYTDVQFSGGEVQNVDLIVGETRIWACARSGGGPMTVTTAYQEYEFGECFDEWLSNPMMPGDTITVSAGAGELPVVINIPVPFEALGDSVTDQVTGQIDSLDGETVEVQLHGSGTSFTTQTDASGAFTATLSDIPRGGEGEVRWYTQVSYADVGFHKSFGTLDIVLQINEAHEWVQGNYEAGYSGVVTVTDSGGSVKATAQITTGTVPDWGPDSRPGFSTNTSGWTGSHPDIQPGDWVYAWLSSGYTASVRVGTITGYVDAADDSITGTINIPWLSSQVPVQCEPWGAPGHAPNPSSKYDLVTPNGSDPYSCSWDPATEWDVEPGQDIGVFYTDPDAHQIFSAFYEPAPYLRIEKQAPGWSRPAEGGNFVFEITVWNDGGADAEGVVVTDTMDGLSYLTDTSGIVPTGSGSGPIVWDLGTLTAGASQRFRLFAHVDALPPETVTNTVEATTANPYNQSSWEERFHWWTDQVQPNGTQLNLGKWAWQAPAPGYDAIFTLNACGNGETASTAVTITDSLPPSMTLKGWWADDPGWQQVLSETHTLVVAIPSLPGQGNCSAVYLRAGLDPAAEIGLYITNTATITASNDLDAGDNEAFWDGWVNHPYQNLYVDKWFNGGTAVPGGELRFSIGYGNEGSIAVDGPIHITDTMPAGTSFSAAWWYDQDGPHPMDPVEIDGQVVVWDVGSLESGESGQFDVHLRVDTALVPPAMITNCVDIGGAIFDENPYDNDACFAQPIAEGGTNLAVHKTGWWEDTQRAGYRVLIENLGTTRVDNVMITDTLPVSATLDPNWGIDFHRWWQGGGDSSTLTATIEYMEPGETAWLNFSADFADPLPYGIAIANTVQVTTPPDDVNAGDNEYVQELYTGPDLAVVKWMSEGDRRPGSLLTYTLHIENAAWWGGMGDVWVTDTLPADVTLVDAVWRLCGPDGYFCPAPPDAVDGNVVGWQWASGGFDSWWQDLVVTVRISDTVEGGQLLINEATIGSNDPSDIEPDYTNNTSISTVEVVNPVFAVSKEVESAGVAGMPLTYTLTLTNTGNLTDTNVVLSDTVPAALADIDTDGDYSGGDVTWPIAELGPGAHISGWISGLLPCTLQDVVNDQYYVVDSDEGLTSPMGAPVTTAVIAPSINVSLEDSGPEIVSETVFFTATAATDGTSLSYAWDVGAGPTPGGSTASYAFPVEGTYPVTVTVTDRCGFSDREVTVVVIEPPALTAAFDTAPDPAEIVVGANVVFTDASTTDGPPIVAWHWDFGDGTSDDSQDTSHTYLAVETVDVTLTITDTYGYTDTVIAVDKVSVSAPTIVPDFEAVPSPPNILVDDSVVFTDTTTTNGPTIVAWHWDFGDGGASDLQNPNYAFGTVGAWDIALTVTDSLGYSDTVLKPNLVNVASRCEPLTAIDITTWSPTEPVVQETVTFTATVAPLDATQPITFTWAFGDGQGTSGANATVQHTYVATGTQSVSVTAYNPCTLGGVSDQQDVGITPRSVYMPLVIKNTP